MSDAIALDEIQLRNEMERGNQARELLDNQLIAEFFSENEKEIWQAIKTSPIRNVEDREKLLLMFRTMEKFRSFLVQTLETGKMASLTMESRRSRLQKAREWISETF